MPSDNEAAIGLLRGDGSAKPEFFVLRDIAKFVAEIRPWLKNREPEPVVMVIPHSNMFSIRNTATDSTKRAVRAMVYHCGMPMRAIGEYNLQTIVQPPQLIVMPSPVISTTAAGEALRELTEKGSFVLTSGPGQYDQHWLPKNELAINYLPSTLRPLNQEEVLKIDNIEYRLSFRGEKIQRLQKIAIQGQDYSRPEVVSIGKGKRLNPFVPVELADNIEPTIALYKFALKSAGIKPIFTTSHFDSSVLIYPAVFQEAVLFTIVSEGSSDASFKLTLTETNTTVDVQLRAQRTAMILVSRKDGRILGQYK
jgi:hypothetical protein